MPRSTPRPKTIALVMHGARADAPELRHLVRWVRARGHTVEPRVTWESGDGTRFAREAVARGADVVVAVGGDGTVNEVLNGLDGSDTPLGIIPFGTANDFARQTGIPDDPDHAMDVILQRKPVRIDTAELNGRRFLNVSTGGVAAEATAETSLDAKESLGTLAYAITGVKKLASLRRYAAQVTAPGVDLQCKFLVVAVGNARATGGGSRVTPRARVTDGLLDVCIVEFMPRGDFARLLLKLRRGEHIGEEGVRYLQVPWITIAARRPVSVNVDGEPMQTRTLEYRARRGDLRIHLPHLPEETAP
ncbi:MAG TPA: YegS/Rv2252/BmrU family lipid kinase [Gemmatimonadaceae bacterium]|nr:YegS/Rv2252/BmrU family lipid kinase [Gemmatimonadaceae bacterium]